MTANDRRTRDILVNRDPESGMWPVDRAIRRIDYRLTFSRSLTRRAFYPNELYGPDIPDARNESATQMSEWFQEAPLEVEDEGISEATWIEHFLSMAVNEAVHEVLEYFRVDGGIYLDPHGDRENDIYAAVNILAARLARLTPPRAAARTEATQSCTDDQVPVEDGR